MAICDGYLWLTHGGCFRFDFVFDEMRRGEVGSIFSAVIKFVVLQRDNTPIIILIKFSSILLILFLSPAFNYEFSIQ